MKKVRILTIHFGVNHGSVLQAWALSRYIGQQGYDAAVIDYIPQRYRLWNSLVSRKGGDLPKAFLAAYYPVYALKNYGPRHRFDRFVKENLPLTKRYIDQASLLRDPPEADICIAGSDQIWNDDYNGPDEESYYLPFAPTGCRKIAYSASFGKSYPLPENQAECFRRRLENFDSISLREDEGVQIAAQCGQKGIHVCDPTLLLTKEQWSEFASDIAPKEPYLLVYVMDYSTQPLLDNAQVLAKKAGLKICVVSFSKVTDPRVWKCYDKCTPADFVSLVKNASMVVTNSFHGTAFATVFQKPMLILGKAHYNSRMTSLLKKAGLSDRFVPHRSCIDENQADRFLAPLTTERDALDAWIRYSREYLQEELHKTHES